MSAFATLAGVPLAAEQEFSWPLTEGVRPQQRTFETDAAGAAAIMKKAGQPVDFVIESPGWPTLKVEKLYVLASQPGSRPETASILVADRRWLLNRFVITRDFNLRRNTGETRYVGDSRIENKTVVADVAYAPWSLNKGAPWKPVDVLKSILDEVAPGEYTIDPLRRKIEIEDLSFSHPGDAALEVALFYCGGLGITVDPDGRYRVFDKRDRSEVRLLASSGPAIQGAGYSGSVDRKHMRPAGYEIHFERRCELRFDFDEDNPLATVDRAPEPPRRMENVMPSPDTTLVMDGKVIAPGTLRTVDQFLAAWAPLAPSFSNGPLTQAIIRRYYVGMGSMLYTRYGGVEGFADPRWIRRIAAIFKHWRKTFRIRPAWRDKIRNMSAERVAVLDPETNTAGRALAWLDYISIPSYLPMLENFFGQPTTNPDMGRQISGYPTGATLSTGAASPALVTVDERNGVIRVDLQADRDGEAERMIPGNADGLPKAKCIDTRKIGAFKATLADVALLSGFKCAVVISAIQACPNNLGRYHTEKVTPQDAEQALDGVKIGECKGPTCHVFVSGNVAPARFAWHDGYATAIEGAFFRGDPYPDSLLVNKTQVRNIAIGEAARQYATMLDRIEGAFAVPLNPALRVTGAIRLVEHAISPEGDPFTRVLIDPEIEPVDLHAMLPQSDQRALRKMVDL